MYRQRTNTTSGRLSRCSFAKPVSSSAVQDSRVEYPEPFGLKVGFWALSGFYLVYCARPQEVIPGLSWIPLAQLTGAISVLGLILSLSRSPRKISNLPREASYLLGLIGVFFLSAIFSPVWKGGAFFATLEFSKVCILWMLAFLLITNLTRLRRIVCVQAASVAVVS